MAPTYADPGLFINYQLVYRDVTKHRKIQTFWPKLNNNAISLAGYRIIIIQDCRLDINILLAITRRERLKSALYPRLKKRKRLFFKKNLKFLVFFRKCRIVRKNVKGGTSWAYLTYILLQNIKKLERGTLLRH